MAAPGPVRLRPSPRGNKNFRAVARLRQIDALRRVAPGQNHCYERIPAGEPGLAPTWRRSQSATPVMSASRASDFHNTPQARFIPAGTTDEDVIGG